MGGRRIIGDIGGTNARFAIAEGGKYRELMHVEVSRFGSLHDALTDYLNGLPPALRSRLDGALAVAGPVFGDRVALTNLGWSFSISDLHRSLGLGSLKVVNDFAATAMAVPHLPGTDVFPVGPRTPAAAGPIGIIGPGTGLGVSALIPDGRKWVMVAGEGGHVTLPSASQEEDAIIEVLRKRWSHVSAERVLSGAGLVNLYEALCTIDGSPARALTPADVTRYAIGGTDLQCVRAFSHFCAFLGVGGRRPCADVRRHRRHIHRRRDIAAVQGSVRVVSVPRKIRTKGTFRRHAGQNSDLYHPRRVAGAPRPRSSAIGRLDAFSI